MRTQPETERAAEPARGDERRPGERELADLRKEVLEARNLIIKNDNLLKNLHAELKAVGKKNDDQFKRTWYASAAAYAIFILLAGLVAMLGANAKVSTERARVSTAEAQAEAAKKESEGATDQFAKLKKSQEEARAASERALTAYKLMSESEGENRAKGIDELAKVNRQKLTTFEQRVIDERARSLKGELAQAAFERGKLLYRRDDWKGAVNELRRFLALDPEGSDSIQAHFYLGCAFYQLKDWEGAVGSLDKFTVKNRGKNVDYALYLEGQALEQLGRNDKAAEVYRRGVGEFPGSEFLPQMQLRLRIAQKNANGSASAMPAPTPAGAAPTAAPAVAPAAAPATPIPAAMKPAAASPSPAVKPGTTPAVPIPTVPAPAAPATSRP